MIEKKRIALVHDFLLYPGGAEKVLVDLARLFPDAPIYTLLVDLRGLEKIDESFGSNLFDRDIRQSFLGRFPRCIKKRYRFLAPFFPSAVESMDLRDFDIVISSSGAWSKGLVTRTHTKHIAYLHSPMRFVWDYDKQYWRDRRKRPSLFRRLFLSYLRLWDVQASDRPDILLSNSFYTKKRIEKYYRRESEVIYPGVFSGEKKDYFLSQEGGEYFLIVSRLNASKRVDLAVSVCEKLGLPLIVIGDGPERKRLEKMGKKYTQFLGWLPKEEMIVWYKKARAFIFPSLDDFGIAPVEAMLYGIPIIAISGASASEILLDDTCGILCDDQSVDGLADGIRRFLEKENTFSRANIQKKAQRFSKQSFEKKILQIVSQEEK
ncbi:MAG: glycosyltransferase [Candidatus Moraniibacteriota bacterium]|nr:MAG: glycosyltransferase [Candidatus Moranbacteria bacterium]